MSGVGSLSLRGLDHVVIAVGDLDASVGAWSAALGRASSWRGDHPIFGTRNALFRLDGTCYFELLAAADASHGLGAAVSAALRDRIERPFALAIGTADLAATVRAARSAGLVVGDPEDGQGREARSGVVRTWRSAFVDPASLRGLRLLLIEHTSPPELLPPAPVVGSAAASCAAIDHVVVFSDALEESLALWTGRLGLPLAWRRDFPERGTRNAGVALGDVVLELIERTDRAPRRRGDVLWGAAFRVGECGAAVERLRGAGVPVDEPRDGLDAGTRVASLRWGRTPALVIAR